MDVRFDGVSVRRSGREVLHGATVQFAPGRVTALLGPNGAGKTTMLRLIAGLERATAGQVLIGDTPVRAGTTSPHVAYAFQSAVFLAGSLANNLELALRFRSVPPAERATRVREAAAATGIAELLGRDARRLSGGEAQRANLARALAMRAPVTLLDEPLSGLDAPGRRQLLHELPALLRAFGTTAIVVTHDRDEALRLADALVVLLDGKVRAQGPRAEVFGSPPNAATARFLGYTLLPGEGGELIGVAPRALRPGPGEVELEMQVDDVLDLGVRAEAWGTVRGVPVSVSLRAGERAEGAIVVSAARAAVTRFRE
ncbi:MAG: ABC transporter ATP-binding protein [Dehalococcoidia bacterium]|nr:ABC transporter ATP-binding protein [Dehalococcoidia bacterium]